MYRRLLVIFVVLVFILTVVAFAMRSSKTQAPVNQITPQPTMQLSSSAFMNNGLIPSVYTCDGAAKNPPLEIHDAPPGTKSFALIMWDPDVPTDMIPDGNFDHWVVFNIPPTITNIPEAVSALGTPGSGTSKSRAYVGPCPPNGEHRYFFKLYALDDILMVSAGATRTEVEAAMQGHILDTAELMARYHRQK